MSGRMSARQRERLHAMKARSRKDNVNAKLKKVLTEKLTAKYGATADAKQIIADQVLLLVQGRAKPGKCITEGDLKKLEDKVRQLTASLAAVAAGARKPSGGGRRPSRGSRGEGKSSGEGKDGGADDTANLPSKSYLLLQRYTELQYEKEQEREMEKAREGKSSYRAQLDRQIAEKGTRRTRNLENRDRFRAAEADDHKAWLSEEESRKSRNQTIAQGLKSSCLSQLSSNEKRRAARQKKKKADEEKMVAAAQRALRLEAEKAVAKKEETRQYMNKVKAENKVQRKIQARLKKEIEEEDRRIHAEGVRQQKAKDAKRVAAFEALQQKQKGRQFALIKATKAATDQANADAARAIEQQREKAIVDAKNELAREERVHQANVDMTRKLREQVAEKKERDNEHKRQNDKMAVIFRREAQLAKDAATAKEAKRYADAVANRKFLEGQIRSHTGKKKGAGKKDSGVLSDKMTETEYRMNKKEIDDICNDSVNVPDLLARLTKDGVIAGASPKKKSDDEPSFW